MPALYKIMVKLVVMSKWYDDIGLNIARTEKDGSAIDAILNKSQIQCHI